MKSFKNILGLFLVGILCCSIISNVYAKTLTINEISNKFNTSSIIDGLNQLGLKIRSLVDPVNKTFDVYVDSEKMFSFTYTDEYIEYNNRDAVVTVETAENEFVTAINIYGVMDSIFELSGYKDKTLPEPEGDIYADIYDTYGIQVETEKFSFSGTEDNGSWSISGDFIKYFKISFDTDKISALVEKFGVDASIQDPNKEVIANLTPTLEARDITENSVTLYPHINYKNTNSEYMVYCYIYRSTSEDGTYERISDVATNCLDDIGFVDNNLNSNTTYYYKAVVMDGTKYSDAISITTKGLIPISNQVATDANSDDGIENPQTGFIVPFGLITVLGISGFGMYHYAKKRDRFI